MASGRVLIDHDEIRRWAEERGARPAHVKGTGSKDEPGMIVLDFPGFSGDGKLEPISWDEWFAAFERNNLALIVQDRTARGQRSNFNKLVSRESVLEGLPPRRRRKQAAAARKRAGAGARTTRSASQGTRPAARGRTRKTASTRRSAASTKRKAASSGRKTATASSGRNKTTR